MHWVIHSLTHSTSMWPFRKPSPGLQQILDELSEIRSEQARQRRRFDDLDVGLSELEAKHMNLRGRVYSAGIHKKPLADSEEERQETIPIDKDELRKAYLNKRQ